MRRDIVRQDQYGHRVRFKNSNRLKSLGKCAW
jgi:hypothetical protein